MLTFGAMKNYFIRLFNYNEFANTQINQLIVKKNDSGKAIKLMAHLLGAEQIWLKRCKGILTQAGPIWPDWDAHTVTNVIAANHAEWVAYLNELNEADFDKTINYKNSLGVEYNMLLSDIIAHVINHGTHTRAQAGQHLKLNDDDKLPVTDYSYYVHQLNNL